MGATLFLTFGIRMALISIKNWQSASYNWLAFLNACIIRLLTEGKVFAASSIIVKMAFLPLRQTPQIQYFSTISTKQFKFYETHSMLPACRPVLPLSFHKL